MLGFRCFLKGSFRDLGFTVKGLLFSREVIEVFRGVV